MFCDISKQPKNNKNDCLIKINLTDLAHCRSGEVYVEIVRYWIIPYINELISFKTEPKDHATLKRVAKFFGGIY